MSNSLKRKRQVDSFKRRIQTTQSKIAIAGVVGILIGFFVSLSLMGGLYSANPHVFAISDNAITRYLGLYDGEKATIGFLDGDEIIIGRFDGNNILIESDGKEVSSVTLGEMSLDEYAAVGDVAMISGAITNIGARSECTDSDGGFAYHEKGKTSDGMITREDRCLIDGMTLKEFFCMDGLVSSVRNDCSAESKVCLNGICAEEVASGIAGISTGGGGGEECPTEADHCCWGSGGSFCTLDQFSKCKKIRKESECSIKDNKGYKTECCEWEIPSAYTKCTKSEDTARSCCYNTVEKEYYREGDCVKGDKFQYSYNDGYCGCVKSTEPCFLLGTKISTPYGDVNIENVEVGDDVLSYNEGTGENEVSIVSETFVHDTEGYLMINGFLGVTPNHPMWINGEWAEAGTLEVGDVLRNTEGEHVYVESVESAYGDTTVYNLEVSGTHTYYAEGLLAHNKGGCQDDSDCDYGVCVEGICEEYVEQRECDTDSECTSKHDNRWRCNKNTGECYQKYVCLNNNHCPGDGICDTYNNKCRQRECSNDGNCPDGKKCDVPAGVCYNDPSWEADYNICGDGDIDPGEECDDGNTRSGDGCSSDCEVESYGGPGYDDDDGCGGGGVECPPGTTCVNGVCMGGSSDGACFLAGTRVSMSDGSFGNIEDVEVGDLVKSYNPSTGEVVSGEVVIVFRHTPEEMREDYYLIINQKMSVTPEHRIFTSRGLIEAGDLVIGSEMVNEEGGLTVIETIQKVSERVYTYNLEIGKYQTYFAENIAVHNLKDESGGCSWDGSLWTLGDYMWCVVISAA